MSTSNPPFREHSSTYFVQGSNEEEMSRLQIQGQMITAGMGGVLPEQPDPTRLQRVLDVGCGTGDWLIEVARTYPSIPVLVGIDVNSNMVQYARTQAATQHVEGRVQFHIMDALRMLEFPSASFDLVNQRLGMSYLRTWDWPKLLGEYRRVTRPGGVIRITECNFPASSSAA
ncbi:MAG TPA: class I SAM-dependent methyltransferase, partial [Ktedonobacteraceae bacterium]|nr:class I SAM-dependent methyltransferase [Ktedonobacteraceae bacterium]